MKRHIVWTSVALFLATVCFWLTPSAAEAQRIRIGGLDFGNYRNWDGYRRGYVYPGAYSWNPRYSYGYWRPYESRFYSVPSTSYYDASPAPAQASNARVIVYVPEGGEAWVNGQPAAQQGSVRVYDTPTLAPGQSYRYDVFARWMVNANPLSAAVRLSSAPARRCT
ncbi:MAG: hypothetical protein L0215_05345 [Gemmataceae bacterium]|nr:hypothetical protein [Gemmataceae bacterium]